MSSTNISIQSALCYTTRPPAPRTNNTSSTSSSTSSATIQKSTPTLFRYSTPTSPKSSSFLHPFPPPPSPHATLSPRLFLLLLHIPNLIPNMHCSIHKSYIAIAR
ncbi:hypothetical protein VNO80_20230 [Phaseolus coccineus]|uniref:Uncharacterized protein n=1 Tax=Phaseolus coccineus TaxID=3886 RepID=A0AAN9R5L2_PHACN